MGCQSTRKVWTLIALQQLAGSHTREDYKIPNLMAVETQRSRSSNPVYDVMAYTVRIFVSCAARTKKRVNQLSVCE
jgi:hypothetical protein